MFIVSRLCSYEICQVAMKYAKLWEGIKVNNTIQDDGGSLI